MWFLRYTSRQTCRYAYDSILHTTWWQRKKTTAQKLIMASKKVWRRPVCQGVAERWVLEWSQGRCALTVYQLQSVVTAHVDSPTMTADHEINYLQYNITASWHNERIVHHAAHPYIPYYSRRTSQGRWSHRTIPNTHGHHEDCGCWLHRLILNILGWLQQNVVKIMSPYRRPACGHVCRGRSASQSTASHASAVLIGRKKSRKYLI